MPRYNRADFYKGLLMWGVIWGHLITCFYAGEPNNINIHWIFRTYDMPFFMAISGFFLRKSLSRYTCKELLLNKVTTIAFPTLLWSLVNSKIQNVTGFYFLWAVFWSAVIVIPADKWIVNRRLRLLFLCAIGCAFYFVDASLANLSYLFPFFVAGYYKQLIRDYVKWFNLSVAAFVLLLCFWSTDYNIWNAGSYVIKGGLLLVIVFRIVIAVAGIVALKNIADVIYDFYQKHGGRFYQFLLLGGRETMALYILHAILISRILAPGVKYAKDIFHTNYLLHNEVLMGYMIAPAVAFGLMVLLCYVIKWIKRNRYTRMVFGFKFSDFK